MKLSDIPKKTKTFWYALGEKTCNMIRDRVQKKHKNVYNESFAKYDENYAKLKSQSKAAARGQSQQSTSITPDMTLTGKTMSDLKVINATEKSVTLGWIGIFAGIIESLYGRKNYKVVNISGSGDPLAKNEMDMIMKSIKGDIDKKIKSYCKTPIIIKVGI